MKEVFLCDLTHTGQNIASDCFPYGIGCIASYLEKKFSEPITVRLFKFPDEVFNALMKIKPGIVGFANYVWNFDLSKRMAQLVKEVLPETVIVFGGPNFPKIGVEQEAFLRRNSVIDFFVEGEGEQSFLMLAKALYENNLDIEKVKRKGSPGVRTIFHEEYLSFDLLPRLRALDEVPSPYLTGKMDPFFDGGLMPIIQTNRGCPFSCTYCVEGHPYYNRVVKRRNNDVIGEEINYIAKRAKGNKQLFIADSNFGMYKEDLETASLIGQTMDRWGYPSFIHVATGKNRKDNVLEVAKLLQGRLRLSGSVQTLDSDVMANIRRKNISTKQILDLARFAREIGANSYSEVILGLPGDSLKAHMFSMKGVVEAGFNYVLPWTLMILTGSELGTHDNGSKYGLEYRYRVLPKCFGIYKFGDKEFMSGEVEEVCVSQRTLSFEDYLNCRIFTLTTALFYNDQIFLEILEILKDLGLSPFKWLIYINDRQDTFSVGLKQIYEEFKKETCDELWTSRDELEQFMLNADNMKRYISGNLGFNIMYHHRSKALVSHMSELNEVAFDSVKKLILDDNSNAFDDGNDFFEQLKEFSLLRKSQLFDFNNSIESRFDFNFQRMCKKGRLRFFGNTKTGKQFLHKFYCTSAQADLVKEQINLFGSDQVGLTKVLSRIPINKLFREAEVIRK